MHGQPQFLRTQYAPFRISQIATHLFPERGIGLRNNVQKSARHMQPGIPWECDYSDMQPTKSLGLGHSAVRFSPTHTQSFRLAAQRYRSSGTRWGWWDGKGQQHACSHLLGFFLVLDRHFGDLAWLAHKQAFFSFLLVRLEQNHSWAWKTFSAGVISGRMERALPNA